MTEPVTPPFPELEAPREVEIVDAAMQLVRDDGPLARFFAQGSGVRDIELEELLSQTGIKAPACFFLLDRVTERWETGPDAKILTRLGILVVTAQQGDERSTGRFLRARVAARIRSVFDARLGVLRNPDGDELTTAVLDWDTVPFFGKLQASGLIVTALRPTFTSHITTRVVSAGDLT